MLEQLPPFTQIFLLWVPLFEQSEFLMHKLDWVLEPDPPITLPGLTCRTALNIDSFDSLMSLRIIN